MTLKIHPSSLGQIMTEGRSKTDLLGETCKKKLNAIFIEKKYHRYQDFSSKMIEKGNANEETGITMLSNHINEFLLKNEITFQNDYLIGTPDIIHDNKIFDIKCSWSIHTFMAAQISKDYYWQMQAYMELTGINIAYLTYCLTDTPEKLIEDEIRRAKYKCTDESLYIDIEEGYRRELTFGDIPDSERIKIFKIERNQEDIDKAKEKINLCRDYYSTLSLTMLSDKL